MNIKILGAGCPKCRQLEKNVRAALENLNIEADVEKVTDINDIMKYEVMMTPALVINGTVRSTGRVYSTKELEKILQTQ